MYVPRSAARRGVIVLLLILTISVLPALTSAGLVAPGQTISSSGDLTVPIPGTVVAESTTPFHIDYVLGSPPGFELVAPEFVDGTVTSQVIRDDQSGELAFFYTFAFTSQQQGSEQSSLVWKNFDQFTTDVRNKDSTGFQVGRSADGAAISQDRSGGLANVLPVAIFTNATHFDQNGSLRIQLGDEVVARDPNNPEFTELGFASGETTLNGMFEPASAQAIPLPAAVWAGATMLPIAIAATRRKSHQR